MTFISCKLYLDQKAFLLRFRVGVLKKLYSAMQIDHMMSFYAWYVSLEQIYYAFAEQPNNFSWKRLKEMTRQGKR